MKIKVPELKKHLKAYDQKELIDLVVDLFKTNKDVQNYLSSKFLGEEVIEALYQEARKKVQNEFFPDRGDGKLRLAEARKVITAFKKATNDEKRMVDLMLFFVEQGVKYTNTYGDIDQNFYNSVARMFDQVAIFCDGDEELYQAFSSRLLNVFERSQGIGWGFEEVMGEIYYSIEWVFDEVEDD